MSLSFRLSRAKRSYFSDDINCSDIEEEIIKQIKMLKPFDMETRKAIPKKPFYRKRQITVKRKLI